MIDVLQPVAIALFLWWFSTGAIIYLDGLPRWTFPWTLGVAGLAALGGLWGMRVTAQDVTLVGAYGAFASALAFWAWHEIGFYTGLVTGPKRPPCAEDCAGWRHLWHAIMASLYHELGLAVGIALVIGLTWDAPNQLAAATFVALYLLHQSAKLNVMLGVPNLNEDFLPAHLGFIRSFLRRRAMNGLFPLSITLGTLACALVIARAWSAEDPATRVGLILLSTIIVLGTLEHWFLVLPLPIDRLWRWSLSNRSGGAPMAIEIVAGFLGAGKTTYVRRLIDVALAEDRLLILVNDFATLGLDGSLLAGRGATVIDLPNGCMCCSLKGALAPQILEAWRQHAPRRVLIEPSGVADVAALVGALNHPSLAPAVGALSVTTLIDAGAFVADYARLPAFFEAQVALATRVLVNKADAVGEAQLGAILSALREINPEADIRPARYGAPVAPAPTPQKVAPPAVRPVADEARLDLGSQGLGMRSWSARLVSAMDTASLAQLLEAMAQGSFGPLDRVKGIAEAEGGWVRFDVAGGRSSVSAFAPRQPEQARVMAIGRDVDGAALTAAFAACAIHGKA